MDQSTKKVHVKPPQSRDIILRIFVSWENLKTTGNITPQQTESC